MYRKFALAFAATLFAAGAARADPIEGTYRTPKSGATAKVAACGSSFCMTYVNGKFAGKQFAKFQAKGNGYYTGTLTDYTDGAKEYTGKAKLQGKNISVIGCILFGTLCSSELFTRL